MQLSGVFDKHVVSRWHLVAPSRFEPCLLGILHFDSMSAPYACHLSPLFLQEYAAFF